MTTAINANTHPQPELEFTAVDLLDLYRRLNNAGEPWSRASKAGCLEFVAAMKTDGKRPASKQASAYRKMLRRLLELEGAAPPPLQRGRRPDGTYLPLPATVAANEAIPGLIISAGQSANIAMLRPPAIAEKPKAA